MRRPMSATLPRVNAGAASNPTSTSLLPSNLDLLASMEAIKQRQESRSVQAVRLVELRNDYQSMDAQVGGNDWAPTLCTTQNSAWQSSLLERRSGSQTRGATTPNGVDNPQFASGNYQSVDAQVGGDDRLPTLRTTQNSAWQSSLLERRSGSHTRGVTPPYGVNDLQFASGNPLATLEAVNTENSDRMATMLQRWGGKIEAQQHSTLCSTVSPSTPELIPVLGPELRPALDSGAASSARDSPLHWQPPTANNDAAAWHAAVQAQLQSYAQRATAQDSSLSFPWPCVQTNGTAKELPILAGMPVGVSDINGHIFNSPLGSPPCDSQPYTPETFRQVTNHFQDCVRELTESPATPDFSPDSSRNPPPTLSPLPPVHTARNFPDFSPDSSRNPPPTLSPLPPAHTARNFPDFSPDSSRNPPPSLSPLPPAHTARNFLPRPGFREEELLAELHAAQAMAKVESQVAEKAVSELKSGQAYAAGLHEYSNEIFTQSQVLQQRVVELEMEQRTHKSTNEIFNHRQALQERVSGLEAEQRTYRSELTSSSDIFTTCKALQERVVELEMEQRTYRSELSLSNDSLTQCKALHERAVELEMEQRNYRSELTSSNDSFAQCKALQDLVVELEYEQRTYRSELSSSKEIFTHHQALQERVSGLETEQRNYRSELTSANDSFTQCKGLQERIVELEFEQRTYRSELSSSKDIFTHHQALQERVFGLETEQRTYRSELTSSNDIFTQCQALQERVYQLETEHQPYRSELASSNEVLVQCQEWLRWNSRSGFTGLCDPDLDSAVSADNTVSKLIHQSNQRLDGSNMMSSWKPERTNELDELSAQEAIRIQKIFEQASGGTASGGFSY